MRKCPMTKDPMTNHWVFAVAAVWILLSACASVRAQEKQPVNALILHGPHFTLDAEMKKRLEAEGIRLVVRDIAEPVSPEMLRLFHVVVLSNFDGLQAPTFVPHQFVIQHLNAKRNIELLHAYVAEGGGVFFSPDMRGGGKEVAEGCSALLAPWGMRVLAAQARDDAHACCDGAYAWTSAVAQTPVSAGVRRIVYPTNMLRWDDAYACPPLVVEDKQWQVVVRGMPGSAAATGLQYKTWFPIKGAEGPVIAAVRQVEKGRVAALGVSAFYTLWVPFEAPKGGWVGESCTGPIDGIFLEKGDGQGTSDGFRLLLNMLRWLAEGGRAAGFGGYTEERLKQLPAPAAAQFPPWLNGWNLDNGKPIKVLIGARSRYSDGQSTVAELAEAARKAGYSVLVMTETFERLDRASWDAFVADCDKATGDDLIVMPGIDIPDTYENRFLLFGQRAFPDTFMLSEDGKALKQAQYLSLGFGTHFTAIHRPSSTPLPHHLYKFFAGVVVFTYRAGKLVDNGLLAYEWQVGAASQPIPLAVHEVHSAAELEAAATGGHQLFIMADTARSAAWYLRPGMQHFWESPSLFLVSAGPMVRRLYWGRIELEDDVPIKDVQVRTGGYAERRWAPNAKQAALDFYLPPSQLRWSYVYVEDEKGRSAVSPPLHSGPAPRYTWRCSDRQNFFGFAMNYTGTRMPDVEFVVPAFGTEEGRGTWPHGGGPQRGENLAPLLDFPYASPEVYVTDIYVDQRYWKALWEDVAYDGKASQGTSRARVFDARVRYYDYKTDNASNTRDDTLMLKEVTLRLRIPVVPDGPVFPRFTSVARQPEYGFADAKTGQDTKAKLDAGFIDLPVGGYAGNLVALSPGIRVSADGSVGFAAPEGADTPLPAMTSWSVRYVRVPAEQLAELRAFMGCAGRTPYELKLARGRLMGIAYEAQVEADAFGAAGEVAPAQKAPFELPLVIAGLNRNWDAGLWREDGALDFFGVFEGKGFARLDVTKGGRFYAGNVITAQDPRLRLSIIRWDDKGIQIEANNPTGTEITALVETPKEIQKRYRLSAAVTVPAGACVRQEFAAGAPQQ